MIGPSHDGARSRLNTWPYEIRSQLGGGGMGVVYLAQDPRLDRRVAIKVLPSDLTRELTAKQRYRRDALFARDRAQGSERQWRAPHSERSDKAWESFRSH